MHIVDRLRCVRCAGNDRARNHHHHHHHRCAANHLRLISEREAFIRTTLDHHANRLAPIAKRTSSKTIAHIHRVYC